MLSAEKYHADGPALRPDGPRSGRFVVVVQTVRVCAESVRVLSFLRGLLAKTTRLALERTCNGSIPPAFI
jgi:hypothetical protein